MTTWYLQGSVAFKVTEMRDGVTISAVDHGEIGNSQGVICMENRTGMVSAPHREYGFASSFGQIRARIFLETGVGCLSLPAHCSVEKGQGVWLQPAQDDMSWRVGFGILETTELDLARCERRHWPKGVENNVDWENVNILGKTTVCGGKVLRNWCAPQQIPSQGWTRSDTDCLRAWAVAPGVDESLLRDCLRAVDETTGLPSVLDLPWEDGWSASEIADGLLYVHQRFGARMVGMGRPTRAKIQGLEQAHNDAQGDVCGLWTVDEIPSPRGDWQSLGAWTLAKTDLSGDLCKKSQ